MILDMKGAGGMNLKGLFLLVGLFSHYSQQTHTENTAEGIIHECASVMLIMIVLLRKNEVVDIT